MKLNHISLITLGVADMARARRFYAALGWECRIESGDKVTFFQGNGFVFGLYALPDLAADQGRQIRDLGTGAASLAVNFATEADVDAAFARALAAGATPLARPEAADWGGYAGMFADPDGHVWEVAMNPHWTLAADGGLHLP